MTGTVAAANLKMTTEAGRWFVEDRDGTALLVTNHLDDPVLVEWDDVNGGWTCSTCGPFPPPPSTPVTCHHVMAAGRRLPLDVALSMVPQAMSKHRRTSSDEGAKPVSRNAELKGIAASVEAGAAKRAEEARRHDEHHRAITSEVTVRQMTEEDRRKLEERRRRKRLGGED